MTTITNILLVDDHPMLRKGLRLLIELEEDLKVIGEANDGKEAIERVRELAPDIVSFKINKPKTFKKQVIFKEYLICNKFLLMV